MSEPGGSEPSASRHEADRRGFVTRRQLRLLACFAAALDEVLGIRLLRNGERCADGTFRFGQEEDLPGTPYVELWHDDHQPGDAWEGSMSDRDRFFLRGARQPDGRPLVVTLDTYDHSLSGRRTDVVASLPTEARDGFEAAFHRHWDERTAAPSDSFTWMLAPTERDGTA